VGYSGGRTVVVTGHPTVCPNV